MLRKHGVGRHNACSALSSMPRAVVCAILGLGLGVAPGQSAAGSVVYIGKVLSTFYEENHLCFSYSKHVCLSASS
jgi:hypothetical protein